MQRLLSSQVIRRVFSAMAGIASLLLFFSNTVTANAAAISQDFQTTEANIAVGALVSLKPGAPNGIELASQENAEKLVGVVGNNPLIALTEAQTKSVQVVTNGVTTALVSNVNGEVNVGDAITASPIAGVGMKAAAGSVVIGTAQANLASMTTSERTITDTNGESHTVIIGSMPVQISITFFAGSSNNQSFMPEFLQDFSNVIAGKEVSPVRVLISTVILLLSFVSIAVLLYASVRSSIISIGRNPLSEVSVRKSLFQIGGIIVAILLLSCITIYLILMT